MKSKELIKILKKLYPEAKCSLDFKQPFELVVAVMLAAKCTDERVNKTTPKLFKKYKTPYDFANADIQELEQLIYSCGFYKNKAKNIKECANIIVNKYNSQVPNDMDLLLELPGVGRKSANVILLEVFGIAYGIAIDTHAKRISNRLGLTTNQDSDKIEQDLLRYFAKSELKDINHLFMWHGRNLCTAQNPKCEECPLRKNCKNKYKIECTIKKLISI